MNEIGNSRRKLHVQVQIAVISFTKLIFQESKYKLTRKVSSDLDRKPHGDDAAYCRR